jgi:glucose/arabinose dehydrogenase
MFFVHPLRSIFLALVLLTGACATPSSQGESSKESPDQASPPAATEEAGEAGLPLDQIELPEGFSISIYAADVPGARSLTLGDEGTVFVGSRDPGKVYALVDADRDRQAEQVHELAHGLDSPNGVAYRDGALYVAEISRILRFDGIEQRLGDPPKPVVISDSYPSDGHHGWKFIAFGPDGWLYVPVGAPCNICKSEDEIYASITRIRPDGSGREIFAEGIRNTVGFDWHPRTGELWFTDNGRDRWGDDRPPDELNVVTEKGQHFGYPYCHGAGLADPEYGEGKDCSQYQAPAFELGPHVAPLGMRFYTGEMFPAEYQHQILIAEHGSWNRSNKIGYRVMLVRLQDGKAVSYEPFAEGWLQGERDWGRPVDVLVMPDGAVLVSDDKAGAVYRISYQGG